MQLRLHPCASAVDLAPGGLDPGVIGRVGRPLLLPTMACSIRARLRCRRNLPAEGAQKTLKALKMLMVFCEHLQ
jgi:hypothetical protein